MTNYFSGQGKVYIGLRDATTGAPLALRHVGNVPELMLDPNVETIEHQESMSGQRQTDHRLVTSKTVGVTFTLEEFTKENLALALYGQSVAVAGASVTAEAFPDSLVNGDIVRLEHAKISSVVVEDAVASPLTLDTHYEIVSADHGLLKLLDVSGFTQPFNVDYDYAARDDVAMFNAASPERYLFFQGLNTANQDGGVFEPVLVELFKVSLDPANEISLINEADDLAQLQLTGTALADTLRAVDATLGQFGKIVRLG